MPFRDIVVIGASTGGLQAVSELVGELPADTPAALFVVIHTSGTNADVLASILERAGRLPAAPAKNGELIRHGRLIRQVLLRDEVGQRIGEQPL